MTRRAPDRSAAQGGGDQALDDRLADEVERAAAALVVGGTRRSILGIVGAPASGKSTLAAALERRLSERAINVPMDGFHLADRQLANLGLTERKGAPESFDARGYQALLARLAAGFGRGEPIYAPVFERTLDQPIAAGIAVDPDMPLVVTEGNYLLLDDAPWPEIASLMDEIWYLDIADNVREDWLAARHMRYGRAEIEAWAWIANNDRSNAERVVHCSKRANRRLIWDGETIRFDANDADT